MTKGPAPGTKHPPDCNHCAAIRGRPKSAEHRAAIGAGLTGNPNHGMKRPEVAARVAASKIGTGKPHPPGCKHCEAVTTSGRAAYSAIHIKASRRLPKACALEDDTCKGRLEVALRHNSPDLVLAGVRPQGNTAYSLRVEDYWRLCKSHHSRYDGTGGYNFRR